MSEDNTPMVLPSKYAKYSSSSQVWLHHKFGFAGLRVLKPLPGYCEDVSPALPAGCVYHRSSLHLVQYAPFTV